MTPVIEPIAPASASLQPPPATPPPAPPPTEPETDETEGEGIPDELLKIPAIQAVVAGSPPAVSMKIADAGKREDVKLIAENRDALLQSGMSFYRSLSGELGVMFNETKISGEDIKAADKAGKLRTIAPDFDLVNHEVAKLGPNHPVFKAGTNSGAPALPASTQPPQSASGSLPLVPPPPEAVQRKLAQQRLANLLPGAPSSGPAPGAGRLLNSILKPVT